MNPGRGSTINGCRTPTGVLRMMSLTQGSSRPSRAVSNPGLTIVPPLPGWKSTRTHLELVKDLSRCTEVIAR